MLHGSGLCISAWGGKPLPAWALIHCLPLAEWLSIIGCGGLIFGFYFPPLATQEPLDSEVWCMLISTAGRANRPDLAKQFYQACKARGCTVRHVDNALMAALARHSNLTEVGRPAWAWHRGTCEPSAWGAP